MATIRRAIVTGSRGTPRAEFRRQVEAYLPANYKVRGYTKPVLMTPSGIHELSSDVPAVFVSGHDHAGWTMDGYVIPRLRSGLYGASELPPGMSNMMGESRTRPSHPHSRAERKGIEARLTRRSGRRRYRER